MSVTVYTLETDVLDIVINQNAPFTMMIEYADDAGVGLFQSGDVLQFRIRNQQRHDATLLADFSSYLTLSNTATASLVVPATQTATLDFTTGYYTCQLLRGGVVIERLIEGVVTLSRNT